MKAGTFVLRYHRSTHYFFVLRAPDEATLLIGKGYATRLEALHAIDTLRLVAARDDQYQRLTSATGRPYFTLRAANEEVLATSETYSTQALREEAIEAVKRYAATAALTG